jgi:hypothetical protein
MRSTIHAVCCGTKRTMVLVGRRLCEEKYVGGPDEPPPNEEKTLAGFVAECELFCVKVRAAGIVKAAASGDIFGAANGREFRSNVEAVLAAILVRDAIVRVWCVSGTD